MWRGIQIPAFTSCAARSPTLHTKEGSRPPTPGRDSEQRSLRHISVFTEHVRALAHAGFAKRGTAHLWALRYTFKDRMLLWPPTSPIRLKDGGPPIRMRPHMRGRARGVDRTPCGHNMQGLSWLMSPKFESEMGPDGDWHL